jgi:maleate isomerase
MDKLETRIGEPAVSSNQALAWDALRQANIPDRIAGQGSLFQAY